MMCVPKAPEPLWTAQEGRDPRVSHLSNKEFVAANGDLQYHCDPDVRELFIRFEKLVTK